MLTEPVLTLALRCRECGSECEYALEGARYDLGTFRHQAETVESPLIVPDTVVCPGCGAIDLYELTAASQAAVLAKLAAPREGLADPLPGLELIDLASDRWDWMPPNRLLLRYESRLCSDGAEDVALRYDYAVTLRTMGYVGSAANVFVQVLMLDPGNVRARVALAEMEAEAARLGSGSE